MKHKIIVGGTGRTGSTILMCLLSYLGLETGYGKNSYKNEELFRSFFLEGNLNAYIIKDHEHTAKDIKWLDQWDIDYYIWLRRDFEEVAKSRIKRWDEGYWRGGLDIETKGDPDRQLMVTMQRYYQIADYLKEHRSIPVVAINFPSFVKNSEYLFNCLIKPFPNLEKNIFEKGFKTIFDIKRITTNIENINNEKKKDENESRQDTM